MILETQNLNIGYTSKATTKTVASEVSIQLEQGKLIGLVGANGIGKSTLLRTLTGIQKPLSGTVLLNEKIKDDAIEKNKAYLTQLKVLNGITKATELMISSL